MAKKKFMRIMPPPNEKDLFRVVYVIDVGADNASTAAKLTHKIMADPDSIAPVLEVIDSSGKRVKIDLSKDSSKV